MKKDTPKATGPTTSDYARKDPYLAAFPNLVEAIADRAWDDGTPREPWTLAITFEFGQPSVKLSDKGKGRTAQVLADTIEGCFLLLDHAIAEGTLSWRVWHEGKRR